MRRVSTADNAEMAPGEYCLLELPAIENEYHPMSSIAVVERDVVAQRQLQHLFCHRFHEHEPSPAHLNQREPEHGAEDVL